MIEDFGSRKFNVPGICASLSVVDFSVFHFLDNSDRAGHLSLSRSEGAVADISYTKFSLGLRAGANFYLPPWEPLGICA